MTLKVTPIVVAFTQNYYVPVATMLRSLLDSSRGSYHVICLLTEDLPERMQRSLELLDGSRMEFEYRNLGGRLKDVEVDPRYTEAALFRLLLPDLLPDYDKVVYIDCDVIVRQDVAGLCSEVSIGDNYVGAVFEAPIENQAERIEALGCLPAEYFNSGFLLMNLKQMRAEGVVARFMEASKREKLEFPDQDVLNMVCRGRVFPLSPVYNSIRTFLLPHYKSDFLAHYSIFQWKDVQEKGTIHYTGGKPWNLFTVKFGEWWRTYERLPQQIKDEWTPDAKVYRLWKIYRTGPGRWCVDTLQSVYRRIKY
ncbi:MAG: glycosyltransferase family 8 protein [Bacteroidaceae bacterium]|nr:glycosyltransferase family 8 protein [Bacteroidaceae bacterium]